MPIWVLGPARSTQTPDLANRMRSTANQKLLCLLTEREAMSIIFERSAAKLEQRPLWNCSKGLLTNFELFLPVFLFFSNFYTGPSLNFQAFFKRSTQSQRSRFVIGNFCQHISAMKSSSPKHTWWIFFQLVSSDKPRSDKGEIGEHYDRWYHNDEAEKDNTLVPMTVAEVQSECEAPVKSEKEHWDGNSHRKGAFRAHHLKTYVSPSSIYVSYGWPSLCTTWS